MDIDKIVRCTACPQKTHTLDNMFNMSIFNYNTVSEVSVCVWRGWDNPEEGH